MSMKSNAGGSGQAVELEVVEADALVERMKAQNPDLGKRLSTKRLATITSAAVQALAAEVNGREEGRLLVPGLGRIVIRQVERERGGEVVRVKHVGLQPILPKK